jgi:hypothetical protein
MSKPASRRGRHGRLHAEGYAPLPSGWVPIAYAQRVAAQVEAHREDVERIAATERKRGRLGKTERRDD